MRVVLSSVLLSLALSGCVSTAGSGRGASRDPNLINNEEMRQAEMEGLSATQLIERLRSRWLQGRGATSLTISASGYARVMLNGAPYGELEVLSNMDVSGIEEMRFLNARDATTRFGTDYDGGAILVVSRGRRRVPGPRTTAERSRVGATPGSPPVQPGERVRVTAEGSWTGVVQMSGSDSISLLVDEVAQQISFSWASVKRLEVSAGRKSRVQGALRGAGVGGGVGLVGGMLFAPGGLSNCRLLNRTCESMGIVEAAGYSAAGMVAGGVVGALIHGRERWRTVDVPVQLGFAAAGGGSMAIRIMITYGG